jgi:YHS domain-containing protein
MIKHTLLTLSLITATLIASDDPKGKTITCVVSGDEINKSELEDHDHSTYRDGKVYFCCGGCKMDFDESPKKFASKANFQLVSTGQYTQTACPVNNGKIHTEKAKKKLKKVTVNGMEVDLCCPGCLKKYNKASDKFALIFSDKGYEKGFSSKDSKKTKSASK